MGYLSAPADLALHGVRVLGFATTGRVAARYGLDVDVVNDVLLDFEALGWVRQRSFAGSSGWALTDTGAASPTNGDWPPSWTGPAPGSAS